MLDKFVAQFQEEMGIPGSLSGETAGTYSIPFDEETFIILSPLPSGFGLSCNVIEAPKDREDLFLEKAMRANLFGQGTEGSILGLNEEANFLTLVRTVDTPVDYKTFKEILEDFMNSVEFWKAEVDTHNKGE